MATPRAGRAGLVVTAAVAALAAAPGCTRTECGTPAAPCPPPAHELDLADALAARGFDVRPLGTAPRRYMSVPAELLGADDQTLELFRYPDEAAALAEAARIGPDGASFYDGSRVLFVTWVAPPHFFRRVRLIVFYAGEHAPLLDALSELLGPPFAGVSRRGEGAGVG